jgi:hypothetical protein
VIFASFHLGKEDVRMAPRAMNCRCLTRWRLLRRSAACTLNTYAPAQLAFCYNLNLYLKKRSGLDDSLQQRSFYTILY